MMENNKERMDTMQQMEVRKIFNNKEYLVEDVNGEQAFYNPNYNVNFFGLGREADEWM